MTIQSLQPGVTDATQLSLRAGRSSDAPSFDALLGTARGGSEADVRHSAEQLVATAFIAPILRDMREHSQAEPPFAPTPAEKQFGALLDARTAEQIVRSADLPLVDRLTTTFLELAGRRSASTSSLGAEGVLA
ncbi:MAG: hypothetical protein ACTS22_02885 [Phycisphaerales bacterium]